MKRRSPPSRPRPKAGTSRQKFDCLDLLTGDEALAVRRELLSSHPDLLPDGRRAVNALLATVSFTDIAKGVVHPLLALDLEDFDAGPRAGGYFEPSEAAWKANEEVVTPYFHDLERRVKLRHENEAVELCKGIVPASIVPSTVASSSSNMPKTARRNLAGQTVDIWQRRRRNYVLRTFIEKFTPDWDWLVR